MYQNYPKKTGYKIYSIKLSSPQQHRTVEGKRIRRKTNQRDMVTGEEEGGKKKSEGKRTGKEGKIKGERGTWVVGKKGEEKKNKNWGKKEIK
jgi:hypothetical protein